MAVHCISGESIRWQRPLVHEKDNEYLSEKIEAKEKPKLKGKLIEAPSVLAGGNLEQKHFVGTPSLVVPNLIAHQWTDFVSDETAEGNLEHSDQDADEDLQCAECNIVHAAGIIYCSCGLALVDPNSSMNEEEHQRQITRLAEKLTKRLFF